MERNRRWIIVPVLLSATACAGIAVGMLHLGGIALSPEKVYQKLVIPVVRLLCFLGLGLLAGQMLEALGWMSALAGWVSPLTRWAHLKGESGAALATGFVSGILANTILMNAYLEKRLTRREVTVTYLLNASLPTFLVHLPTTFFIVASLAGSAGMLYMGMVFAAACLRGAGLLIYGRSVLPVPCSSTATGNLEGEPKASAKFATILNRFQSRFVRVVLYTIPIYVLVFLVNEWGLFQWLRQGSAGWISKEFFPVEAAGVIIFALAAEFSSGMAAAGALLEAGSLTAKQTALALILGTIIAAPIRAVRHQLPTQVGLFRLAMGTQLLLLSQGLRIFSLLAVAIPYAVWW
ncbi:MAG: nucleoside recognition domain-containing protein [Desulfomonile tiedjei]|nr:nucleoside recognition domain-containing protein [Desulfomonile tiedjei]